MKKVITTLLAICISFAFSFVAVAAQATHAADEIVIKADVADFTVADDVLLATNGTKPPPAPPEPTITESWLDKLLKPFTAQIAAPVVLATNGTKPPPTPVTSPVIIRSLKPRQYYI